MAGVALWSEAHVRHMRRVPQDMCGPVVRGICKAYEKSATRHVWPCGPRYMYGTLRWFASFWLCQASGCGMWLHGTTSGQVFVWYVAGR